jgi:hypothetical protein
VSLKVTRVAEGLWQWGVPDVTGVFLFGTYVETPDAIVLIDPPLPPAGSADAERFWTHLDRDVARQGSAVGVALTCREHSRGAPALVERYSATLWCPPASIGTNPDPVVQALSVGGGRVVFYLVAHRALVQAEGVHGGLGPVTGSLDVRERLGGHA